jgi:hypothetical protein
MDKDSRESSESGSGEKFGRRRGRSDGAMERFKE